MARDLSFQALKLSSQYIVSNPDKIPEGKILQITSCMNQENAETIGILEAIKVLPDVKEDPEPNSILFRFGDGDTIKSLCKLLASGFTGCELLVKTGTG